MKNAPLTIKDKRGTHLYTDTNIEVLSREKNAVIPSKVPCTEKSLLNIDSFCNSLTTSQNLHQVSP